MGATKSEMTTKNPTNSISKERTNNMTNSFYEVKRHEDGRLQDIIIFGDGPTVKLNPKGQQGYMNIEKFLIAATEYFKFGKYNHPQTMPGLHVYSRRPSIEEADLEEFYAAISVDFCGKYGIPVPDAQKYPEGWLFLNKDGNVWKFSRKSLESKETFPKEDGRQAWCRKQRWIDRMIRGCRIEVRVLPMHKYAETFLKQWEMPFEDALVERDTNFKKNDIRRVMNSGLVREYHEVQGKISPNKPFADPQTGEVNAGLTILTVSGEYINTNDIQPGSSVAVVAGDIEINMVWDGSYHAQTRMRQVQLNEKAGWAIKVQ